MSKFIKFIAATLFTLLIIFVAAAFYITKVMDPNDFKDQISAKVTQETGRDLVINGKIGWHFFPWLGVELNQVELGNPPAFQPKPFASLDELDVRVKLIPLLSGNVEIGNLTLKGLSLNLITNRQGKTNWGDLLKESTPKESEDKSKPSSKKPTTLNISEIHLANANLIWDDQQNNQYYELSQLNFNSSNIRKDKFFPIDLSFNFGIKHPPRKHKVKITSDIRFKQNGKQELILSDLKARVDDSNLSGDFVLKNFDHPKITFDFLIDKLNLDTFGKQGKSSKKSAKKSKTPSSEEIFPVGTLRVLDAKGKLTIKRLIISNSTIRDVNVPFNANGGMIKLSPVTANLYKGGVRANISMDARSSNPKIKVQEKLANVQAGPLLKDLAGEDFVTGTLNFEANLSTQGNTDSDLRRNLNGTAGFSLKEGQINGMNIDRLISMGEAFFNKLPLPSFSTEGGANRTRFSILSGTAKIVNGVSHNDDLYMSSRRTQFDGQGTANFNNEKLNYKLQASRVDRNLNPLGYKIPIRVTGSFDDPTITPDFNAITKDLTTGIIKERGKDVLEGIEKIVPEQFKNIFNPQ